MTPDVELAAALGFEPPEYGEKIALLERLQDFLGAMPGDSEELTRWDEASDHLETAHFAPSPRHERHEGSVSRCRVPVCVEVVAAPFREGLARAIRSGLTVERCVMLASWVIAQDEIPLARFWAQHASVVKQARRFLGRGLDVDDDARLLTAVHTSRARGLGVDGFRACIIRERLAGWEPALA